MWRGGENVVGWEVNGQRVVWELCGVCAAGAAGSRKGKGARHEELRVRAARHSRAAPQAAGGALNQVAGDSGMQAAACCSAQRGSARAVSDGVAARSARVACAVQRYEKVRQREQAARAGRRQRARGAYGEGRRRLQRMRCGAAPHARRQRC